MRGTSLAVAAVVLVAGCGSSGTPAATVTVTASSTPSVTEAPTSTPTSLPSPVVSSPPSTQDLPLGTQANNGQGFVTTVVKVRLSVAQSVASQTPGGRWFAAYIKSCVAATGPEVSLSWSPWTVVDSNDGTYPASNATYVAFPVPEYPFSDVPILPGRCKAGWVVFGVTKSANIVRVEYSSDSGFIASWKV